MLTLGLDLFQEAIRILPIWMSGSRPENGPILHVNNKCIFQFQSLKAGPRKKDRVMYYPNFHYELNHFEYFWSNGKS